jgi:hypothetical protein
MSHSYIKEKAAVAMYCLAVSDAGLAERIANAWLSALDRLHHGVEDWSAVEHTEALEIYARVRSQLAETVSRGNTPGVLVALQDMSRDEQLAVAQDIADFHAEVMPV